MDRPLLAIIGPTAVGKSALALKLAGALGGEIVNADSRQVYRHMDIGTAKPSTHERAIVPHHLVDVADPDEDYSLVRFLRDCKEVIQDVQGRSRLPILVGGTGQYVWALLEGWQVPEVPPDPDFRRRLERRATDHGYASLHEELSRLDPQAAIRIDARNVRRVIRALEVARFLPERVGGTPSKEPPTYRVKILGLTMERSTLYRRIDERVDIMMQSGWVDEVRALLEMGYSGELPSLSSVGYGELVEYIGGKTSKGEALDKIKYRTHGLARHQYAWFRLSDERIQWHDAEADFDEAELRAWAEL